jgi:SAM-dependent methyltransferase
MSAQEWPVTFFDGDYLRIYEPQLTPELTKSEVDFMATALDLPQGAAVLDVGCGVGRHAVGMAARGYRVTGVDFSAPYLEIAAQAAARAGAEVTWRRCDMRELDYERTFAGVYSYFTSFGYYTDAENEAVLGRIARALEPGGRFLIDMANRERTLTHPQQRGWNPQPGGGLLMEEVSLDLLTSRVTSRQILIPPHGGSQVVKTFELRLYTCAELTALMSRHGLRVVSVWGGADRSAYSTETRRMIILAERGGEGA